jgi:hypothetical protein
VEHQQHQLTSTSAELRYLNMGLSVFPVPSSGMTTTRFPAAANQVFNIPAGLTLQHTVTSTTTYTAGQLPAQVWAVVVGGGGSGGSSTSGQGSGGGGGGGIKIGWVDVPSAGITATIGAGGGARGAGTNSNGNLGGATVFGSVLAHGGGGGANLGNSIFDTATGIPFGEGVPGYGGTATNPSWANTNSFGIFPNGAPFGYAPGAFAIAGSGGNTLSLITRTTGFNNFMGGGAGGSGGSSAPGSNSGGSGFTGGGGGNGNNGGASSRDGGLTNTFAGGTAGSGSSGGGAGFLAAGSNGSGSGGGNGGSGGGGGGSGSTSLASGAGGNGCILIYF